MSIKQNHSALDNVQVPGLLRDFQLKIQIQQPLQTVSIEKRNFFEMLERIMMAILMRTLHSFQKNHISWICQQAKCVILANLEPLCG